MLAVLLTRTTLSGLANSPTFNLGTEPELHPPSAQIDHRLRHVLVCALVLKDRVALGETQDVGHSLRVKQVFCCDSRGHLVDPTSVGGGSIRGVQYPTSVE